MKKTILLLLMCLLFPGIHAQTYKELFDKAIHYEDVDSLTKAEAYYKEALKMEPANAHNCMIFGNLGRLQRRMQRLDEAVDSYNYALSLAPLSIPILMDRASLFLEMGNVDRSYIDCSTVLDVDKDNTKALLLRAYLQCNNRSYKESLADYKHLLELEPGNIPGGMGLVTLYQKEQKYAEALEIANKLIIEAPEDAELYILRAGLEKDMAHLDLSLFDLDKSISLAATYANAYVLRGEILLAQKKKEMAKMDFYKAIELGIPRSDLMEQLKECK